MNKETLMTKEIPAMQMILSDPVLYASYRLGVVKQLKDELLDSGYTSPEMNRLKDEINFIEQMILLLKKADWMTDLEFDAVLATIEEMQYVLERKVEWSLTDALPYEKVKDKVGAAQSALNDLYVYVMSAQKETTND